MAEFAFEPPAGGAAGGAAGGTAGGAAGGAAGDGSAVAAPSGHGEASSSGTTGKVRVRSEEDDAAPKAVRPRLVAAGSSAAQPMQLSDSDDCDVNVALPPQGAPTVSPYFAVAQGRGQAHAREVEVQRGGRSEVVDLISDDDV
eukprot:1554743-Prymnesium_polylepis.1